MGDGPTPPDQPEERPAVTTQLLILALLGAPAQPPADTKAEAAEASALAKKVVDGYVVEFEKAGKRVRLEREAEPVMRWTNHLGRRFYGDVYVWTLDGRPEVVASVNSIFTDRRATSSEIQSLSTGQPVLSRDGKVVWEPEPAGVEFKPLPGAPKPGATAAARLIQMRALAAQFSVVADYGIDKEQKEDLRLMATPVFRYLSAAQDVLDGGLFAFTKGTDPDAFLLIEARGKKDAAEWQFAFVRFNGGCTLRGTHSGKDVWQADRLSGKTTTDPKHPYFHLRN
jgi:hypothetical protein